VFVSEMLSKTVSSTLICLRTTMWFVAARTASGENDAKIDVMLTPQVQV